MFYKVFDIEYDKDGQDVDLPTELIIELYDGDDPEDELADAISDKTGWLVNSLDFEELPKDFSPSA